MFRDLLAAIEGEINKVVEQQRAAPHDINIATKKMQLRELAMNYIKLEKQFREVAGLNSIY